MVDGVGESLDRRHELILGQMGKDIIGIQPIVSSEANTVVKTPLTVAESARLSIFSIKLEIPAHLHFLPIAVCVWEGGTIKIYHSVR